MKTLQIIPLLTLSALTGVSALGQISYTSQSRSVSVSAQTPFNLPLGGTLPATDYELFDASIGGSDLGDFGFVEANAEQNSSLTPTGFSFAGAVSAFVSGGGFADASSQFSIQFEVAAPTAFSLQGGSTEGLFEPAAARIARMDVALPGFSFSGGSFGDSWNFGEEFSLEGLLEVGTTYTFTAFLEANAEGFSQIERQGGIQPAANLNPPAQGVSGNINFSLVSPVPETGTTMAGLAVGGLALWQWRRRRA